MTRIRFDDVRSWLFTEAWPFWASHGVDATHGGFVEYLDLAGRDGGASYKRVRAQARQIFCFSQAALLGWAPGRAASDQGWAFLMTHGRLPGGGWARRMGRAGGIVDATSDAYDIAFVLFAHAWRYRLTGDPAIVDSAIATIAALDRSLAHPAGLGWLPEEAVVEPLQQNPHMHLMEAAIELALATEDPRFATWAGRIADLARSHLLDHETGVLHEFFHHDWRPLGDVRGLVVEPGHQMEWAWMLARGKSVLTPPMEAYARALYAFAERHGVDPATGLTYDRVSSTGAVLGPNHRLWPQAEAVKANLAMLENQGLDTRERIAAGVDNLLDRYLATAPRGTFIDHLTQGGEPMVDRIPSTTLYHVQIALTELLRLRSLIEALPNDGNAGGRKQSRPSVPSA